MEVMKQLRQRAIRDLVDQRPIRTQQELAAALRERGFRTTQATISRDVAELGLIKVSREGTQAYALPPRLIEAETSGEDRLRKLLADLPVEFHEAGLLLVIRTLPGSAHAIAAALDRARWPEVAGLDRRRRHAVRRLPRSRLAAADQAPPRPARGVTSSARQRPLRLVQVGMGGWGRDWMKVTVPEPSVAVVGYVDPSADARAATIRAGALAARVFPDLESALRADRRGGGTRDDRRGVARSRRVAGARGGTARPRREAVRADPRRGGDRCPRCGCRRTNAHGQPELPPSPRAADGRRARREG